MCCLFRRGTPRRMAKRQMTHLALFGFLSSAFALTALAGASSFAAPAVDPMMPQFRRGADATQLIVDGRPSLILGGELGNSTAASAASIQQIWPRLRELNVNTVLAPVYWELLEPAEGKFDFTLVDALIDGARQHE